MQDNVIMIRRIESYGDLVDWLTARAAKKSRTRAPSTDFLQSLISSTIPLTYSLLKERGAYRGGKRRIDRMQVLDLSRQGASIAAIASELGCSRMQVYRILDKKYE